MTQEYTAMLRNALWTGMVPLFYFLLLVLFFSIAFLVIFYLIHKFKYDNSLYAILSKRPFGAVRKDTGAYGEYLTLNKLENISGFKAFLINVYIPKANTDTTEIDVLMIHEKGIFVFESKNYSGGIYGTETDHYWTQCVGNKRIQFYNPIKQNANHIKALHALLPMLSADYFKSVIVFSERCELKKLGIKTPALPVIQRQFLRSSISKMINASTVSLTNEQIMALKSALIPYSYASNETKEKHVENITRKYKH